MLMDMNLPKFDIYHSKAATNYFKNHTNALCPDFFSKKVSSDVRSEVQLVQRKNVSTEHFDQTLKIHIYSGLVL